MRSGEAPLLELGCCWPSCQNREVRYDIKDASSIVSRISIKAVTRSYQTIPDLLARAAHGDLEDGIHELECDDTPGGDLDGDV